jgi:hypothetical protein
MEINSVNQSAQITAYQKQQASTPVQQTTVSKEAEINSSASLQAYKQQSKELTTPVNSDTVSIKSTNTVKNLDTVKAIEQMHTRLNELVKGVRQTNENLNMAAEQVAQMQGSLMSIIKNYPPYPIESMERRELLMSYMSLRKEIESLMVPPPPQPVYEKVKSLWEAMFSQNGQMMPSAVPALQSDSSDNKVQAAIVDLEQTGSQLSSLSDEVTQALLQP